MLNLVNFSIIGSIILVSTTQIALGYDWHEESDLFWAERCDWTGNDLSDKQIPGEQCGPQCAQTSGCTHFTWTGFNGGTCWMKTNQVSRDQAKTPNEYSVCGIMKSSGGPPSGSGGTGARQIKTINKCSFPVWVGAHGVQSIPGNGGWKLDPGQDKTVTVEGSGLWSGRFWGRTECNDQGRCATGQCSSGLQCREWGQLPATLAEIAFNGYNGLDFYDISLVDGFNLPVIIRPIPGSYQGSGDAKYCAASGCSTNFNANCPNELAVRVGSRVVACKSACEAFKREEYCCTGSHDKPETCGPSDYSRKFKQGCPDAYSYAYDDKTSTFACKGKGGGGASYEIQFC